MLAAPLLIAAYTGCNQFYGLDETRPILDNKLTCDCTCNATAPDPVVSVRIAVNTDDTEQDGATVTLNSATLDLGVSQVGLRFRDLRIPRKASITSAVVRFTANGSDLEPTDLSIFAEQSATPATFSPTDDDLTGRTYGTPLAWSNVAAWTSGASAAAQETPELKTLLQPLVDRDEWTDASALVLRIAGTGHRRAFSSENAARAPILEVTYTTGVAVKLPVCASDDVERSNDQITATGAANECNRVAATLQGLAAPCGYPSDCSCVPDAAAGTSDLSICVGGCPEVQVDATCSNFDPHAFERCVQATNSIADCKHFVAATNAAGDAPVCVPSGSALAFHAFGSRSRCEVAGTAFIEAGDREPEKQPATAGIVEFLGKPCPLGGCRVQPFFDLQMEPITFEVRWASDPTFVDLTATGRGLDAVAYDGSEITYAAQGVDGTANGRRLIDLVTHDANMALDAKNGEPLDFGIDWNARQCDMVGGVAGSVGDDGTCAGDGATRCRSDSPDCDVAGGPCNLPSDAEEMDVSVFLTGDIVNQPPTADAGADQNVECTSTAGAAFDLDGRGSSDPDGNLALASWREGSRVGPLVVNGLNARLALGLGQSKTYVLRVIDAFAQADEDATDVSIVDTTPPVIACNAPPTFPPPNRPVSYTATASDTCTASVVPQLVALECFKLNAKGQKLDKTSTCKAVLSGATITISPPQGVGQHIVWTARATDGSGNVTEQRCEIEVVKTN
jgi:hypothetical protein